MRTSNGQFSISVTDLQLRLPVHEVPGAPGTPSSVNRPLVPVHSSAHPAPGCTARPSSRIDRRHAHATAAGVVVAGTASEHRCPGAPASRRRLQKLAHVWVMVYQPAAHGRCRFLERSGKLSRRRPCDRPIEFLARGTSKWSLGLLIPVPRGHYLIRSNAVDRLHHHQRRTAVSVIGLSVRLTRSPR